MSATYDIAAALTMQIAGFTQPIDAAIESITRLQTVHADAMTSIANQMTPVTTAAESQSEAIRAAMEQSEAAYQPMNAAVKRQSEEVQKATNKWREHGSAAASVAKTSGSVILSSMRPISVVLGLLSSKMPGLRMAAFWTGTVAAAHKTLAKDAREATAEANRLAAANERLAKSTERAAAAQKAKSSAAAMKTSQSNGGSNDFLAKAGAMAVDAAKSNEKLAQSMELVGGSSAAAGLAVSAAKGIKDSAAEAQGSISDLAGLFAGRAVLATIAYKSGLDDIIAASAKHMSSDSRLMKSIGGVASSIGGVANTAINNYSAMVKASILSTLEWATGFDSFESVVDSVANSVSSMAEKVSANVKKTGDWINYASLWVAGGIGKLQATMSGTEFNWDAYIKEGQAINELTPASNDLTAKLEKQSAAHKMINSVIDAASDAQKKNAEMTRLASLASQEAIDAELLRLRQLPQTVDAATAASKEFKKSIEEQVAAISKSQEALAKPQDNGVDQQLKSMEEAFQKLKLGEDGAALAAAQMAGATEEQLQKMSMLQASTASLTAAKKAQKDADEALEKAAEKAKQQHEQGVDRINKLQDEIDVLSKTATKADIAMREMARQGFDQDQIDKVGELEAKLEALREKEKQEKDSGKTTKEGKTDSKAALIGSSDAASIFLRGVGGTGSKNNEQVTEQKKTNEYLARNEEMMKKQSSQWPRDKGGMTVAVVDFGGR